MNSAPCWFLTKTRFIAYCMDVHSFLKISLRSFIFPPSQANLIFICLFVYVVLQIDIRPYEMPGKGLAAELHFQAKAPEIWPGLIQGPGHNSTIMDWLILIPEPKYPWQFGIGPLPVFALSCRAQGQSAYYMTVSFRLLLVSKLASSRNLPLSLLALLGSPQSPLIEGPFLHWTVNSPEEDPNILTYCMLEQGLHTGRGFIRGKVSCIPRRSPIPMDC